MLDKIAFYLPLLYPNETEFFKILDVLEENKVKYIELGIPVTNPHMEGQVILEAIEAVLGNGFSKEILINALKKIKANYSFEVILMTYIEGVEENDLTSLPEELYDGLLCVDKVVTINEAPNLLQVYPPDISDEDMDQLLANTTYFSYIISGKGKTGTFDSLPSEYIGTMGRIRGKSDIPVFIGFGIKDKSDVSQVLTDGADGAVIGSEFLKRYNQGGLEGIQKYLETFN